MVPKNISHSIKYDVDVYFYDAQSICIMTVQRKAIKAFLPSDKNNRSPVLKIHSIQLDELYS